MRYFIDNIEVKEEEFNNRLQEEIDNYIPYSQYYPEKDKVKDILKSKRTFRFPIYDKRYKNRLLVINRFITFTACEEEILEMEQIIIDNEYDPEDRDALNIAVALYNAGYRRVNR